MTRENEVEVARLAAMGDEEARQKLVLANLRFVVSIAKEYENKGMFLLDLIGAGNLGLVMAVDRFDVNRGLKFIT